MIPNETKPIEQIFEGNIYIFHAFDVGDDINLERVKCSGMITVQPLSLSKFFKNYHLPLAVELPDAHNSPTCVSAKIHNFGAISLMYQIPFKDTLKNIRQQLEGIDNQLAEQSLIDVEVLFHRISPNIAKPYFFNTRSSYVVIQVDPQPKLQDIVKLKDTYGGVIASTLRFETETLSENQKNEILASAIGYFRGDLIVVDIEAAFIYDDEYQETLDFFEFANIQHLELRYFDRTLEQQLNYIYEGRVRKVPLKSYLPFIGTFSHGPIDDLGSLKVDISVIAERLEGSIKLSGEPYYSELYSLLVEKRELRNLKEAIDKKLEIVSDVLSVLQHKTEAAREDMLTVSIIILICIELAVGILDYLNK
jgi:hypothetical protein